MAIGGGIGGLLIVVVALFLGVDPGSVLPQGGVNQYDTQGVEAPGFDLSQCKTGKDANEIVECRVVATGNSVDGVWSQLLKGYTRPKRPPLQPAGADRLRTGDHGGRPVLLPGRPDGLLRHLVLPGARRPVRFQRWHRWRRSTWSPTSSATTCRTCSACSGGHSRAPPAREGNGVRTELQADCYAGVWAHYAAITKQEGTDVTFLEPLTDKDISDALSRGVLGGRRPHPAGLDGPGQSGVVDARFVGGSVRSGSPAATRPVIRRSATRSRAASSADARDDARR